MNITFACKHCGTKIGTTQENTGKTCACPACKKQLTIPGKPVQENVATTPVVQPTATFCPGCGTALRSGANFCAKCGTRVAPPPQSVNSATASTASLRNPSGTSSDKNPMTAALLSLWPGMGHLYCGRKSVGVCLAIPGGLLVLKCLYTIVRSLALYADSIQYHHYKSDFNYTNIALSILPLLLIAGICAVDSYFCALNSGSKRPHFPGTILLVLSSLVWPGIGNVLAGQTLALLALPIGLIIGKLMEHGAGLILWIPLYLLIVVGSAALAIRRNHLQRQAYLSQEQG